MEIFKDVVGYEGLYQVSDFGRVKSLKNAKVRILKNNMGGDGYFKVNLYKNSAHKTHNVHSLVATAFIGVRPEGLMTDHIDGDRLNNMADNFKYVTNRENIVKGKLCKNNASKFVGVWRSMGKKNPWQAHIRIDGKRIHLGVFRTELEAHNAYKLRLEGIDKEKNR